MKVRIARVLLITLLIAVSSCAQAQSSPTSTVQPLVLPTSTKPAPPSTPSPTNVIQESDCRNSNQLSSGVSFEGGKLRRIGSGELLDIDWSPDGALIAIGSEIGIRILDAATLCNILYIDPGQAIQAIRFSPDGNLIASNYRSEERNENGVGLWDVKTGELVSIFGSNALAISDDFIYAYPSIAEYNTIAFSPNGKFIAFNTNASHSPVSIGSVELWDIETRTRLRTWSESGELETENLLTGPVFDPKGKWIAAGWSSGIRLWDLDTGELLKEIKQPASALSISNDGTFFLAREWQTGRARMISVASGVIEPLQMPEVNVLLATSDNKTIVTYHAYGHIGIIRISDRRNWRINKSISDPDYTSGLVLSPDGKRIATIDREGNIKIWDIETKRILQRVGSDKLYGTGVHLNTDGSTLYFSGQNKMQAYNSKDGSLLYEINSNEVTQPTALHPSKPLLATVVSMGQVIIWDLESQKVVQRLAQSRDDIAFVFAPIELTFSLDGSRLMMWSWLKSSYLTQIWETNTWETVRFTMETPRPLALSADGSLLVIVDRNWDMHIVSTHDPLVDIALEDSNSSFVTFNPDMARLYGIDSTGTEITIWDVGTGKIIKTITTGNDGGTQVSFKNNNLIISNDGKYLATIQHPGRINVWNTNSWEIEKSIRTNHDIRDWTISGDGKTIVISSGSAIYFYYVE